MLLTADLTHSAVTLTVHDMTGFARRSTDDLLVRRVNSAWVEGTGTATVSVASSTGNLNPWMFSSPAALGGEANGASGWTGGAFDSTADTSVSTTLAVSGTTWTASGAALVADVQSWVDGSSNNGWAVLRGDSATQRMNWFITREAGSNQPSLQVTYTPPPPCDITVPAGQVGSGGTPCADGILAAGATCGLACEGVTFPVGTAQIQCLSNLTVVSNLECEAGGALLAS